MQRTVWPKRLARWLVVLSCAGGAMPATAAVVPSGKGRGLLNTLRNLLNYAGAAAAVPTE